jgi:hypothetical protein
MKLQAAFIIVFLTITFGFCHHKEESGKSISFSKPNTILADSAIESQVQDSLVQVERITSVHRIQQKKENTVSGTAFYRLKYCGGVKPTPEIENQFNIQYPLAMYKIRLISDSNPSDVIDISTNASGFFSAEFGAGTYSYYLLPTVGSKVPSDSDCPNYYNRSYGKMTIPDGGLSGALLLFVFPCDPCNPPRP